MVITIMCVQCQYGSYSCNSLDHTLSSSLCPCMHVYIYIRIHKYKYIHIIMYMCIYIELHITCVTIYFDYYLVLCYVHGIVSTVKTYSNIV